MARMTFGDLDVAVMRIDNIALEADYLEVIGVTMEEIHAALRARGYTTEHVNHMVYAWR